MLAKLLEAVTPAAGLSHVAKVLTTVLGIVESFSADLIKEGDAKDAILDEIIQVCQSLKSAAHGQENA